MEKEIFKIEEILSKQKSGKKLAKREIEKIIIGYTNEIIPEKYVEEYIRYIYENGMSKEELFDLTDIMTNSGEVFEEFDDTYIDKHSTGGVGDKVTLVLIPLLSSLGFKCAKMSGRSLGLTGGTADKLESIKDIDIDLSKEKFLANVEEIGLSLMTQTVSVAPADKKIYDLRDRKNLTDSIYLIASSIMSKKIALGCKNLILDVTCGKGAFMKNKEDAVKLGKLMKEIGENFNMRILICVTDMNQPLGHTIGNRLEVLEALRVLSGEEGIVFNLCVDLVNIYILKFKKYFKQRYEETKDIKYLNLAKITRTDIEEKLKNGEAKKKFLEMLKIQNVSEEEILKLEKESLEYKMEDAEEIDVYIEKEGKIFEISAIDAAKASFKAGSGRINEEDKIDMLSGLRYLKLSNEKITLDKPFAKIYMSKEKYAKLNKEDIEELKQLVKKTISLKEETKDKKDQQEYKNLENIVSEEILDWF